MFKLPLPSGSEFLDGVEFAIAEFDHCYNVAHRCTGEWVWASTVFTGNPTMPASAPSHQLHRVRLFGAQTDVVVIADDALGFSGFRHTLAAADDVPLLRGPVLVAAKLPSGAPTALSMAHFELLNAWSTLSWRARRTLRHRIAGGG